VVIGIQPAKRGLTLAAGAEAVARAYGSRLADDLTALGATGKAGDVVRVPARGRLGASLLVAVGLGDDPGLEALRSGAGAAARLSAGEQTVLLALPAETEEQVEAVAEGALLGAYAYTEYRRTNKTTKRPAQAFTLVTPLAETKGAKAQVARAKVLARSVHLVRDLVNTPPSDLHPDDFARTAAKAGSAAKLGVDVWDSQQLRDQGFGGLTAVGQGSAHGPRLVRIEYRPQTARHHIALVGKGITFDSGGLSLKPPTAMEWMKTDMSGAAAVLATLVAVARLKPDVAVTGWLALAENMPSGTAQRPGDVITIYGGKTVEVLNTDAEGRLVLADALVRAQEDHPDVLVDVATLTGAQIVALGTRVSAIMSNDEALRTRVHAVADRVGESMWPMPLPVELRPSLDSRIADLANIGDRFGGMLTAGLFLKEFVADDLAWAHLDIAGPSYNDKEPYGYTPKGATGVAVRTLVGLVEDVDAEGLVEKG
jgi:leucyl aminopeptidase